jgi:mannitol/fructose-specific phosphotransferase system IIA component (Ntr-type)
VGLGSLTRPELILTGLTAKDPAEVLRAFADRIAEAGAIGNTKDADELFRRLREREQLSSTGIGAGIAIPHCKMPGLKQAILAVGLAPQGIDFGAADGQPVQLLFVVVSPESSPAEHLRVLAMISRWIKAGSHAGKLLALRDPQEIQRFLEEEGA